MMKQPFLKSEPARHSAVLGEGQAGPSLHPTSHVPLFPSLPGASWPDPEGGNQSRKAAAKTPPRLDACSMAAICSTRTDTRRQEFRGQTNWRLAVGSNESEACPLGQQRIPVAHRLLRVRLRSAAGLQQICERSAGRRQTCRAVLVSPVCLSAGHRVAGFSGRRNPGLCHGRQPGRGLRSADAGSQDPASREEYGLAARQRHVYRPLDEGQQGLDHPGGDNCGAHSNWT
jgi:hypothetical protein